MQTELDEVMPADQKSGQIATEETACPLCRQAECVPYLTGRDYFYKVPGTFRIVSCRACGHLYMNPRPTSDSLRACYPVEYSLHTELAVTPSAPQHTIRPWYARPPFRWVPGLRGLYRWLTETRGEFIPPALSTEKRALEVGCGVGSFLDKLRGQGWTPEGVEFSEGAVKLATSRGHQVTCGALEAVTFESERFDAIFAWMVIEHLQDPRSAIAKIQRWLKPGGYFCCSVPNAGTIQNKIFGRYWFPYDLPRHLQHFTAKSLSRLLVEEGFEQPQIIHQRTVRSWYASLGARLLDRWPDSTLGRKLVRWTDDTPFWLTLLVSPMAIFLAFIGQANRITVVARKAENRPVEQRS